MLCVQAGLGRCTLLRADSRVYRTCELLSCRLRFVRAAVAQAIVWAVSDQITGYFERRSWDEDPQLVGGSD